MGAKVQREPESGKPVAVMTGRTKQGSRSQQFRIDSQEDM
ncbi:hypothetical protein AA0117_g1968 [Alternaria alternata]|jgi:hypothetical protein|uniref:Uncharacterized protein n=2 Tax=Alternaria sect. Alternaria TaxID=2499237 RepID=A0A4Q4NR67_ALTAL|nr:hypothetical protein AG0111_0g3900 [Alternaria gaisen]RYN62610.1 hypothetical protein AA0118_g5332 [Alternaria tenuissima]RYN81767.1 hypothetical protein AA0117_g1968 [Alternaria alternata]RYO19370.1 hypothetical protein AA0121_g4369 [Alternaria tenuissima]RYO60648.1 hypothetical protein AA0116_g6020 [Alternaria tenuissima]